MRVTNVSLSTENTNVFNFGLDNVPTTEKYLAKAMIGLDADEIVQKFYANGRNTGKKLYNFSLPKREIVARIVFNPDYAVNETFSELRDRLYRAIASSRTGVVDLAFMSGGAVVAKLSGFVTKFEVPYFSKVPEAQLTIKCIDPMLRSFSPVVLDANDLGYTLPIIIGDNKSTAPHGFRMQVTFTSVQTEFSIRDKAAGFEWEFKIVPFTSFQIGDTLHISSEANDKHAYVVTTGGTVHLLDQIEPGSVWPLIFPGMNEFHLAQIAGFTWDHLTHYPAYWGV